jgi:hypothetical protein
LHLANPKEVLTIILPNIQDYYGPGGRGEQRGYPTKVESNGASHNKEDAIRLWNLSEKLTGIFFPI